MIQDMVTLYSFTTLVSLFLIGGYMLLFEIHEDESEYNRNNKR